MTIYMWVLSVSWTCQMWY